MLAVRHTIRIFTPREYRISTTYLTNAICLHSPAPAIPNPLPTSLLFLSLFLGFFFLTFAFAYFPFFLSFCTSYGNKNCRTQQQQQHQQYGWLLADHESSLRSDNRHYKLTESSTDRVVVISENKFHHTAKNDVQKNASSGGCFCSMTSVLWRSHAKRISNVTCRCKRLDPCTRHCQSIQGIRNTFWTNTRRGLRLTVSWKSGDT